MNLRRDIKEIPIMVTTQEEVGLGCLEGKGGTQSSMRQTPPPRTCQASRQMNSRFRGSVGGHGPRLPLLCDPLLQLRQEELAMEAVDGRDVREDAGGDFRRDPCFCQLGTENLSTEKSTWPLSMSDSDTCHVSGFLGSSPFQFKIFIYFRVCECVWCGVCLCVCVVYVCEYVWCV